MKPGRWPMHIARFPEGKLDDAVNDLKKAVDNFDKMDKEQQEKAAQQMQKMAQQIRSRPTIRRCSSKSSNSSSRRA